VNHVVLLGDSIFDNAAYVPDRPPVIEQVRKGLPASWKATLLAVDGHTLGHIASQLPRLPEDATHLVISVGGNDALVASALLLEEVPTVGAALALIAEALEAFRVNYNQMLALVLSRGLPCSVCTIYDAIPNLEPAAKAALVGFNDSITRAAISNKIPLIDLRVICSHPNDYSPVSPIEPSVFGGAKIADVLCRLVTSHDFAIGQTTVWT
jgi:hypothetical protein